MRLRRPLQISLRTAIGVPVALLFAATVALHAFTQQRQISHLIDQESVRLLSAVTSTSRNRLASFLEAPFQIQRTVADAISRHHLYRAGDMQPIHEHLRGIIDALYAERGQLGLLGFGSREGDYAAIRREDSRFRLILKDQRTRGLMQVFEDATPTRAVVSVQGYDPRTRPWYIAAQQAGEPAWSPIYTVAGERGDVTISAATPVIEDGTLVGVVQADVRLDSLNRFLQQEPLRGHGEIFVIDKAGQLVAHSAAGTVLAERTNPDIPHERLQATASASPQIRAAASHLPDTAAGGATDFRFALDDTVYYGRVTPLNDLRGLDWRIVVLLPETDLLGDTRQLMRRSMLASVAIALVGLLLGLWVLQRVARPIQLTTQAANRLARGEWDDAGLTQRSALREPSVLIEAFNQMAARLQYSFRQLQEQLLTDQLTQLLTRRGLLERAAWTEPRRAALSLVGLDAFRSINDSVGFGTGDRLLQAVADRLRERMPQPVLIARLGSDEFALLHLGMEGVSDEALGRAVQVLFGTPFTAGADEVMLNASVGVVSGEMSAGDLPDWLRNASIALGDAKRRGRNQCVVFEPGMVEQSMERARLAAELRQALDKDQFLVHYQPVIDLATGRVTGAEALLRWQSPTRGMVPPGVFIPVAEESDLILGLGDWVLRHATQAIAQRLPELPPQFDIHINVSARQLIQSDFSTRLRQVLRDSGLPPHQLTLELTESVLIEDDALTHSRLVTLRGMGVKVAIDDFGTGYSSLAYMSRLPFDCLKVDQSFVRTLVESPQDAAIVAAVLSMAKGFGVTVVAEGVETQAQASRLRAMGCPSAQGYCFGRPAPLEALDLNDRTIHPEA
ncbi:MAG: EAL domain-containing protein [Comamonadaceae bacterium]|nr:MAG: EAL domain-containing protein [Comamonadaceae bacterium]